MQWKTVFTTASGGSFRKGGQSPMLDNRIFTGLYLTSITGRFIIDENLCLSPLGKTLRRTISWTLGCFPIRFLVFSGI